MGTNWIYFLALSIHSTTDKNKVLSIGNIIWQVVEIIISGCANPTILFSRL